MHTLIYCTYYTVSFKKMCVTREKFRGGETGRKMAKW